MIITFVLPFDFFPYPLYTYELTLILSYTSCWICIFEQTNILTKKSLSRFSSRWRKREGLLIVKKISNDIFQGKENGFSLYKYIWTENKSKQVQDRSRSLSFFLSFERISIMIKSIYKSEYRLCSSKQIIISLNYLCLSYITMRNNDTINNKLTHAHAHARINSSIYRHMITISRLTLNQWEKDKKGKRRCYSWRDTKNWTWRETKT